VAIIDALVLTPLDEEWRSTYPVLCPDVSAAASEPIGPITYHLWTASPNRAEVDGRYLVAAASMALRTPGQAHSAAFAKQCVHDWRPARITLLGIAGSLESKRLRLGDVVVADRIFGYEVGDAEGRRTRYRPTVNQAGALDLDRVRSFRNDARDYAEWQKQCLQAAASLGLRVKRPPVLHIEAVGSGNEVVKSVTFARKLRKEINSAISAVEMEGVGLHAAIYLDAHRSDALMIRGISDYADGNKTALERRSKDRWRAYAAANAARLLSALWRQGTVPPLSPDYAFDLTLGTLNRWRQPGVPNDHIRRVGAHDLLFPTLITRSTPAPAFRLSVQARSQDGSEIGSDFVAHAIVETPARQVLPSVPARESGRVFEISPTEWGLRLELLLSFPTAVAELQLACSDQFGRLTQVALTIPTRRRQ
jgi:nucleoside phosphorylase